MSDAFDGSDSERWIAPFADFVVEHGLLTRAQVDRAARLGPTLDTRLGWLAVARGDMSARDVYAVLSAAQDREGLFGELAVQLGVLRPDQIAELLTLQRSPFRLFVQVLLLSEEAPAAQLLSLLHAFAKREGLAPPEERAPEPAALMSRRDLQWREEQLFRTLDRVKGVATLPAVVTNVLALVDDPEADIDRIARLIGSDPGLAAQLLRVANSALYGRGRPIATIEDSIRVLGAKAVRQLVLTSAILNKFSGATLTSAERLWRHSVRSAAWAHELGRARGLHDDPLLHGLLHEIGHLVLLQAFGQDCAHIEELARSDASIEQAERQIFGTTHADVGVYVCRLWSLPDAFGQATLHHETPTAILRETPALLETTRVVHAACRLSDVDLADPSRASLDASFLEYHALTPEKLAELLPHVDACAEEMMRCFA